MEDSPFEQNLSWFVAVRNCDEKLFRVSLFKTVPVKIQTKIKVKGSEIFLLLPSNKSDQKLFSLMVIEFITSRRHVVNRNAGTIATCVICRDTK